VYPILLRSPPCLVTVSQRACVFLLAVFLSCDGSPSAHVCIPTCCVLLVLLNTHMRTGRPTHQQLSINAEAQQFPGPQLLTPDDYIGRNMLWKYVKWLTINKLKIVAHKAVELTENKLWLSVLMTINPITNLRRLARSTLGPVSRIM
jgi:hypothetical protein